MPGLASHFLDRCCRRIGRPSMRLSSDALKKLSAYEWPGNVRELRNVMERAVVLADGDEILADQIRFVSKSSSAAWLDADPTFGYEARSLEEIERIHITRTLQWTKWKKREASRILGINRSTLDRKLERYQIEPPADL
jgi:Nif-specific regulatory protein